MRTNAVTGATGHLGRLVIEKLLERGVATNEIIAIANSTDRAAELQAQGALVREGDHSRPETLSTAFESVDALLLISGSEMGQRLPQHRAVVDAARAANIGRIAYGSFPHADTSRLSLAPEHKGTGSTSSPPASLTHS